jgi:hypothetical protein
VNMEGENIIAKTVEEMGFANTGGEKVNVKIAKGLRFANMIG